MKKYISALTALALLFACTPENNKPDEPKGPGDGSGPVEQELLYDEVDASLYKYPGDGDTMNPNLIVPDYDEMTLVDIDTEARTATLRFSGEVPEFYKGSIIVPVKDETAYPMFVLNASVSGKTVGLNWRPAQIGEMFFNTSFGTANELFPTRAGDDGKGKLQTAIDALKHFDYGFIFDFKGVRIDLDSDVEVVIDKPSWKQGFSINSTLKTMKAIFTGTLTTGAVVGLEVKGSANAEYKKPLKSEVFKRTVVYVVQGVPVPITYDIDLMAQLGIAVRGSVKFSRDYTYVGRVQVGGTMDFKEGKYTPANSVTSTLTKGDPIAEWEGEVHGSVTGSIYPRIKTYLGEFKWMGLQTDFKPIVGQIDVHGKYKEGKFLHGYELILRSEVCLNAYYQEFFDETKIHYLLNKDVTAKFEWSRIKQPSSFFKKEPEKKFRGGFNTTSNFNVTVCSEEDGEERATYPENEPFWLEAEPLCSVPNPSQLQSMTSKAGEDSWYSYPLEYTEAEEDGDAEVPLTVNGPAGCRFKYIVRLLDGNEEVLTETPVEFETAVEEYTIKNSLASGVSTCTVKDYGGYLKEVTNLPEGVVNTVTWDHGSLTGSMYVPAYGEVNMPQPVFMGGGTWLARRQPGGTGVGDKCNQIEGYDYAWWAQENGLGNTMDGAHFVKETYHGLPCTKFFHSETGTIIYFENILLYWNTGDGEIRTTSLEGVDGWIYQ